MPAETLVIALALMAFGAWYVSSMAGRHMPRRSDPLGRAESGFGDERAAATQRAIEACERWQLRAIVGMALAIVAVAALGLFVAPMWTVWLGVGGVTSFVILYVGLEVAKTILFGRTLKGP